MEIGTEILARTLLQPNHAGRLPAKSSAPAGRCVFVAHQQRENIIHPVEPIGEGLAHMTENDLKVGILIEDAAENHPHRVQSGFGLKSPQRSNHLVLLKRRDHRVRRKARAQIDCRAMLCRGIEDRRELRIVQKFALRMGIDANSIEAALGHRALDFRRGPLRVLRSYCSKTREAPGMLLDNLGKPVVREAR